MKDTETSVKPPALDLEVQELEAWCNPGCDSSTTSPRCDCPVRLTTAASLLTAQTAR